MLAPSRRAYFAPTDHRAPLRDKPNDNGIVLYEGPSLLDGSPIVVVATNIKDASQNGKTGAMVQTFILRQDVSPVKAAASGDDGGICGDCRHRPAVANQTGDAPCYVKVFQAPRSVWECWRSGGYRRATEAQRALLSGAVFRFGTYGDPAAVPQWVWPVPEKRTGYTHQWRRESSQGYRSLLMASVDSGSEFLSAHEAGWRTFRVEDNPYNPLMPGEIRCPASDEAGKLTTCANCQLCKGNPWGDRERLPASVVILDHSPRGRARNKRLQVLQ